MHQPTNNHEIGRNSDASSSDEGRSDKIPVLKRKHEGEDYPPRPAPLLPGSKEGCDEAQSALYVADDSKTVTEVIMTGDINVPSTIPTLRELSAQRLIDNLLQNDDPTNEIASMESHEQSLLLPYLWKEYHRLRDYKHEHKHSGGCYFPEADRNLFMHDGSKILRPEDEIDSPDLPNRDNGYVLRSKFIEQWRYSDYDGDRNPSGKDGISWGDRDLFREDSKSGFSLCECEDQRSKKSWNRDCKTHTRNQRLYKCISSPLLYYRLTAVFGMPPSGYPNMFGEVCWGATLHRIGDEESWIYLSEHRGGTGATFRGSAEASKSALNLLSWLVSDNIPHAYDGILAGCIARTTSRIHSSINPTSAVHDVPGAISSKQRNQLLSLEFWEEYKHLHDFENDHKPSCNGHYFPDADKALFMHNGDKIPYSGDSDDSDNEGKENGYALRSAFIREWTYDPDSDSLGGSRVMARTISWDSDILYRDDTTSGFQLCDCNKGDLPDCKKHPRTKCRGLYQYISSQLLYYRLAAVFEMPVPVPTDRITSCWEVTLYSKYDMSCLVFGEDKGRAKVSFKGCSDASKSALKLLDWLVSSYVPHMYHGLLAGSIV